MIESPPTYSDKVYTKRRMRQFSSCRTEVLKREYDGFIVGQFKCPLDLRSSALVESSWLKRKPYERKLGAGLILNPEPVFHKKF
jgi:hypothetical protein